MEGIEITNEEERFFVKQFASSKEVEKYLNSLYSEWRFVNVVTFDGSNIIVKVICRKENKLQTV